MLAVAFTLHEDGLHSCGHPRGMAFSDDSEGIFEVVESTCQACAALERHHRAIEGRGRTPGHVAAVANTIRPDERVKPWSPSVGDKPAHAANDQGDQPTGGDE